IAEIFTGDDKDSPLSESFKDRALYLLEQERAKSPYPAGHALHGKRLPAVTPEMVAAVKGRLAEDWKKANAWYLKRLGQGVVQRGSTGGTVAGAGGGQGGTGRGTSAAEPKTPFGERSEAERRAE